LDGVLYHKYDPKNDTFYYCGTDGLLRPEVVVDHGINLDKRSVKRFISDFNHPRGLLGEYNYELSFLVELDGSVTNIRLIASDAKDIDSSKALKDVIDNLDSYEHCLDPNAVGDRVLEMTFSFRKMC
jgi:hypothetical protein